MRLRIRPCMVAAGLWLAAGSVQAQGAAEPMPAEAPAEAEESAERDAEARHLFEAGRNAYDDGRYEDALDYFQRGYELSGRPILLYNVGQAADRLRRDELALDVFKRYLEALPDAENRPQVEERIRVLEAVTAQQRSAVAAPAVASAAPDPAITAVLDAPPPRDEAGDDLLEQWWFWAGAGGVVAAVVVVAIVAGSSDGGGGGELTQGSNGMTIAVLSLR